MPSYLTEQNKTLGASIVCDAERRVKALQSYREEKKRQFEKLDQIVEAE